MKLCCFLVFGVTLFCSGECDNTGNDEQLFYVDIVVPPSGQDIMDTMATINNTLYSAEGVTVQQAFKVVGEPRVVTVLKFQALCDWRPLEALLLAANLTMNAKSVYGEMNLAADLKVNKSLLALAPEPHTIHGEFLYQEDLRIPMRGQSSSAYKEELYNLIEYCLELRAAGLHYVNYNVLGEFPIQMLYFTLIQLRAAEMGMWRYKRGPHDLTDSLTRIEHLDDYLSDNYCK